MKISKRRITYLLEVYSAGNATPDEEQELYKWVMEGEEDMVRAHIEKLVSAYQPGEMVFDTDWEQLYRRIVEHKSATKDKGLVMRSVRWTGWAAAIVILLLGAGYFFFFSGDRDQKELVSNKQFINDDVSPPAATNAVITLANGDRIVLDSTGEGILAIQGSVKIVKQADGQIAYRGIGKGAEYNTLNNPRGSRVIGITLADGTKVWLNAASSLKYPTAFAGKERKVEITGEAYFEVAPNPAVPFVVSKDGNYVRVLGTHFNVNAYEDEQSMNVTLLEGSVDVGATGNRGSTIIKPGEQAQIGKTGNVSLLRTVDLEAVVAWKNDLFFFNGVDIEGIMRQVARWYDVDVVFEKEISEKFYAEVSRRTNVSTLLKMLEGTKSVRFSIEGRTIRVMPYEKSTLSHETKSLKN